MACEESIPIARAAPHEISKVMPGVKGPLSFTVTRTLLPVLGFSTTRHVPKGRLLWAAVRPSGLKTSPEAVRCPLSSLPYQVACTPIGKCRPCGKHKNRRKRQHTSDHGNSLSCSLVGRTSEGTNGSALEPIRQGRPAVMRLHLRVAGDTFLLWRPRGGPAREGSACQ